MNKSTKEKLRQIYESTIDSGLIYNEDIKNIDYYSLLCKSTANNQLYKILSCNILMYNTTYQNEDSVLIIFSIPINLNDTQESRHISERIMDILSLIEECFITTDYMNLEIVKEDKFVYITTVKKIKEDDI